MHPNNQSRTVTLSIFGDAASFGGTLEDNGAGILALFVSPRQTQTLTNANNYTGPTTVNSGTLAFAGNGSAANSAMTIYSTLLLDNSGPVVANRISDTSPIVMKQGTLLLKGNSSMSVEEFLGPVILSGASSINVEQPGAAAAQLTFAGFHRNAYATLDVTGPGVQVVGLVNGNAGIIAPYITAGDEWATIGADGRITPWSNYASDINVGSAADHVKLAGNGTTALAATTTRASLNMQNNNSAVPQVLDLAGQGLGLSTGGILSSGAGENKIQGGTLSTSSDELIVTANNRLTVGANIADGGANPTTLVKNGPGVLMLEGTNTYTGSTVIAQGTLVASSDASLGSGSIVDVDGTLRAAARFSSPKGLSGTGTIDTAGFDVEFSGAVDAAFEKTGLGTLTLSSHSGVSVQVKAGVLALPDVATGYVDLYDGTLQAAGYLLQLRTSDAFGDPVLDIGGAAPATLRTQDYWPSSNTGLQIEFGIGSESSDFWTVAGPFVSSEFRIGAPTFLFDFHNLGGVTTGVDYPLMSFSILGSDSVSPDSFAFAPDAIAAGWAGNFIRTPEGVSVRFSAVPEPASYLLAAFGCVGLAAWNWRRSALVAMLDVCRWQCSRGAQGGHWPPTSSTK